MPIPRGGLQAGPAHFREQSEGLRESGRWSETTGPDDKMSAPRKGARRQSKYFGS